MTNNMYDSYGYGHYSQGNMYNQPGYMNPNIYGQSSYSNYNNQQNQNVTNTNKIFVSGINDVRNRRLPPNSDYLFLDNDKNILYQKVVDSKGQFEVKSFEIVPGTPKEDKNTFEEYAKREELDGLKKKIQELQEIVKKLTEVGPKPTDILKKETV